jgi:chorismate dehydratase
MSDKIRLGAVGYLNARPLVFGLEQSPRFELCFEVPSRCADLLHAGTVDLGLIPSIEYLRNGGPGRTQSDGDGNRADRYHIVPGLAISSRGPVASVLLHAAKPIAHVRTIAVDTSSRTSAALLRVLCAKAFHISPRFEPHGPNLQSMLSRCDAALIIGDHALFPGWGGSEAGQPQDGQIVETIDLGAAWTDMTGLPFVYAFWAGRESALAPEDVRDLQRARDDGVRHPEEIVRAHVGDARGCLDIGVQYLRDNIQYGFSTDDQAGLELFYRYAAEEGIVPPAGSLLFYPR